jgi:hypothetical protein
MTRFLRVVEETSTGIRWNKQDEAVVSLQMILVVGQESIDLGKFLVGLVSSFYPFQKGETDTGGDHTVTTESGARESAPAR